MRIHDKNKDFLDTSRLTEDLKKKSVRGGIFTITAEGIIFILRLGSIAILARILMPEHFGLISMVTAITAVAERFKDLGLSLATIQKKEITQEQVSTLFWINLGFGILVMLVICSAAKLIAWFYGDNRLIWITIAISTSFLFGGLSIQHQAILRRQMQFGKIVTINIVATIFSILLAIILAIAGYGYWALVWREIARSSLIAIGSWALCPWMPGLPVRKASVGSMLRFGRDITGFNLINVITENIDQILIGKFYGASLLGIYRQASQLILIPINYFIYPIHFVAESTLSILQNDTARYRQYYKKILTLLSFASMPLAVFIFIHSRDIVLLLLGEKWMAAAEIMKIMAIAAFIKPTASTAGFVMITCGKSKRYLMLGLVSSVIYISAVSIGIKWGAVGIAVAYVLSTYIYFLPMVFIAFRNTPISIELFWSLLLHPVIASFVMGLVLKLFTEMISKQNSFMAIGESLGIGLAVYFATWSIMPGGLGRLKEIFSEVSFVFKKVGSREAVGG